MDSTLPLSLELDSACQGTLFPSSNSIDLAMVSVYPNASNCTYMTFFAYNESRHELDSNQSGLIRDKSSQTPIFLPVLSIESPGLDRQLSVPSRIAETDGRIPILPLLIETRR